MVVLTTPLNGRPSEGRQRRSVHYIRPALRSSFFVDLRGLPDEALVAAGRARDRAVRHGARPVGDERLDQRARGRLRHDGHHDPGRHHPLLAGDGDVHAHRGQDRRHHRAPTSLRHRAGRLRVRLGAHGGLADGHDAGPGMVGARGARGGVGPASDGRSDRRQLRGEGSQGRLRRHRRRRGRRNRDRADPRGLGDHGADLARRLRRRGRARPDHPGHEPADREMPFARVRRPAWTASGRSCPPRLWV